MVAGKRKASRSRSGTQPGSQTVLADTGIARGSAPADNPNAAPAGQYVTQEHVHELNALRQEVEQEALPCKLNENDLNECVGEVMRHMLASNTAKPQVPVPNSQLAKLLKKLQVSKSGITKPVVSVAKQRFLALGWELCEMGTGAGASYVLRSALPARFMNDHIYTSQDTALNAVKLIIQMFLHIKGDKAATDDLRSFLSKYGVHLPYGKYDAEKSDLDATPKEVGQNLETFGHRDPVQALIEQKFLKVKMERALNGSEEEMFVLGDAGQQVSGTVIAQTIESLMPV